MRPQWHEKPCTDCLLFCLFKFHSSIVETCDSAEKKNNKADFAERSKAQKEP